MRMHREITRGAHVSRALVSAALAAVAFIALPRASAAPPVLAPVEAVETVGLTVSRLDQAVAFYTEVLPFRLVSTTDASGREFELLTGVFGARARIARLALGGEQIELTEFLAPRGRPYPADTRANDQWFQHIAIIVSDIDRAYAHLTSYGVQHASTGPQRLPDWNPNAGGISAYYFRDPDGHFLEVLHFPSGKGDPKWAERAKDRAALFLGIDHTAIVTSDTDRALAFYRDTAGLKIAGASTNYGVEQEHLNNVFGARLRITTLKAPVGPGVELLEYLAPRDGRPAPADLKANDLAHWQTTLVSRDLERVFDVSLPRVLSLVSPSIATPDGLGFRAGVLVRDPDGHGVRLIQRGQK